MFRKQIIAIAGALPAMPAVLLVWLYADALFGFVPLPPDTTADRLAFVAAWLLIPGWALLAGIFGAARRGFFPSAIEGTRTPENWSLEVNLRYNINTIEQVVLAAIAWNCLALVLPHDRLVLIPAMAVLFGIGRLAFWIGYRLHPLARTFGMTLTAFPTVIAYLWLAARQVS